MKYIAALGFIGVASASGYDCHQHDGQGTLNCPDDQGCYYEQDQCHSSGGSGGSGDHGGSSLLANYVAKNPPNDITSVFAVNSVHARPSGLNKEPRYFKVSSLTVDPDNPFDSIATFKHCEENQRDELGIVTSGWHSDTYQGDPCTTSSSSNYDQDGVTDFKVTELWGMKDTADYILKGCPANLDVTIENGDNGVYTLGYTDLDGTVHTSSDKPVLEICQGGKMIISDPSGDLVNHPLEVKDSSGAVLTNDNGYTFDTPGTYEYYCTEHNGMGNDITVLSSDDPKCGCDSGGDSPAPPAPATPDYTCADFKSDIMKYKSWFTVDVFNIYCQNGDTFDATRDLDAHKAAADDAGTKMWNTYNFQKTCCYTCQNFAGEKFSDMDDNQRQTHVDNACEKYASNIPGGNTLTVWDNSKSLLQVDCSDHPHYPFDLYNCIKDRSSDSYSYVLDLETYMLDQCCGEFVEVLGCTDPNACNYNSLANQGDGSCTFADPNRYCNGGCINDADGDDVCDEDEHKCEFVSCGNFYMKKKASFTGINDQNPGKKCCRPLKKGCMVEGYETYDPNAEESAPCYNSKSDQEKLDDFLGKITFLEKRAVHKQHAKEDFYKKVKDGKSKREAIRESRATMVEADLSQKVKDRKRGTVKIAVAINANSVSDSCEYGASDDNCGSLDLAADRVADETTILTTESVTGSWAVVVDGTEIIAKQTKRPHNVVKMQCWDTVNNVWESSSVNHDVSDDTLVQTHTCHGRVFLLGSLQLACDSTTCDDPNKSCTNDGLCVCNNDADGDGDCDEVDTLTDVNNNGVDDANDECLGAEDSCGCFRQSGNTKKYIEKQCCETACDTS